MSPLNSIKVPYLIILALCPFFIISCSSPNGGKCPGCDASIPFFPNVKFKLTDKQSNQDLLFGKDAKFTVSELKIRHVENGIVDSANAQLTVDSVNHTFEMPVLYSNDADTITVQLGAAKPEVLYLSTGVLSSCCSKVVVTEATFNGSILYQAPTVPAKVSALGVLNLQP